MPPNPLPTTNPFILKKYYIYESPISGPPDKSIITEGEKSNGLQYMKTIGPSDMREIIQYVSSEIRKFNELFVFAKKCNEIAQSIMIQDGRFKSMDQDCKNRFKAFGNDNINNDLKALHTEDMSTWPVMSIGEKDVKSFIGYAGPQMFDKLTYNKTYIAAQEDDNKKKEMTRRLADLTNMLENMTAILKKIVANNSSNPMTDYPDRYKEIKSSYNTITNLRNELNTKLEELNSGKDTKFCNSKLYLDSTVYTSVLWTILATTLVFYIFKKM